LGCTTLLFWLFYPSPHLVVVARCAPAPSREVFTRIFYRPPPLALVNVSLRFILNPLSCAVFVFGTSGPPSLSRLSVLPGYYISFTPGPLIFVFPWDEYFVLPFVVFATHFLTRIPHCLFFPCFLACWCDHYSFPFPPQTFCCVVGNSRFKKLFVRPCSAPLIESSNVFSPFSFSPSPLLPPPFLDALSLCVLVLHGAHR